MIKLLFSCMVLGLLGTGNFCSIGLMKMNGRRFIGLFIIHSLLIFIFFFSLAWFRISEGEILLSEKNEKILVIRKGIDFREVLFFIVQDEKNNSSVWYYSDIEKIKSKMEQKEKSKKKKEEEKERKDQIIIRPFE